MGYACTLDRSDRVIGTEYNTDANISPLSWKRLHIGNRWMNHAGLSLYDNTARMYDPLTVRFHTPDPLDYKRPRDSPWSHCGGNPANFIDPDGRFVIADNWCQQGILDGLPEEEANLVSFDENGALVFDPDIDLEGRSVNFKCLIELGKSETNYIVNGATSAMVGDELKVYTGDRNEQVEDYNYGTTLMPGIAESPSPDENVYVYTSSLLSPLKRASNIAHELYGHAYFFEKGLDPLHRDGAVCEFTKNEYGEISMTSTKKDYNLLLHIQIRYVEQFAITQYQIKNSN